MKLRDSSVLKWGIVATLSLLTACAEVPSTPQWHKTDFGALHGWEEDHQSEALGALTRSCTVLKKKQEEWATTCAALTQEPLNNDESARRFFENNFDVYALTPDDAGLFTGYYEAQLNGSRERGGAYQTPLYQLPDDLVTADLGLFKPEWKGMKATGKVVNRKFIPYDDRAAVASGALNGRAQPLIWTDDPAAAFFLEVQGSGRIKLTDGGEIRVGYAGQNGRDYVAIGRVLAVRNEVEKPVTMQKIRSWLATHPDQSQQVMNENPSVVFFRELTGDGPVGAQGIALTPERSLAIDPKFIPLGAPVWVELADPLRRLMIAQDTGGAIKGAPRGDLFWGHGPAAEEKAGAMQSRGFYYLLLPKGIMPDDQITASRR